MAMHAALAVLGLVVLCVAIMAHRFHDTQAATTALLDVANKQQLIARDFGDKLSALKSSGQTQDDGRTALQGLLPLSADSAASMKTLLASEAAAGLRESREVRRAFSVFDLAHKGLWADVQTLAVPFSERSMAEPQWRTRLLAAQAKVAPVAQAAETFGQAVQAAADSRAQVTMLGYWVVAVATLLFLLAVALGVVEPFVRVGQAHARRLATSSADIQRLAMVAEHTSALVLITDESDHVVWVNGAFSEVTGWSSSQVSGRLALELLNHPLADPAVQLQAQQAVSAGQGLRLQALYARSDGHELWLDLDLQPLHDDAGRLGGFVRVASDVTERVQQEARLKAMWAALPTGVVLQAADGTVVDANRAAERLLGLNMSQMLGLVPADPNRRVLGEDGAELGHSELPSMHTLRTGEALRNHAMGVREAGKPPRWCLVNCEPYRDAAGEITGAVTCFSDVTERRELQDKVALHARTDTLTGLPNRSVVLERLQRCLLQAQQHAKAGFAVLFMDFDRFKQVNDTMGHGAGDELLRQIAQRLSYALRPGDEVARLHETQDVAARIGGDEFVVVLERMAEIDHVAMVVQRLLDQLAQPYTIGSAQVHSSASIGVVTVAGGKVSDGLTAQDLLRDADTAMYEAKRAGRGRWVLFDNSMHEKVVRALALEQDLRQALAEDQLSVVYQPVFDLATRCMTGVEALVRWHHPTRGTVAPLEFIPVAEESGLIDAVGAVVLKQACTRFVGWRASLGAAAPRLLAVNLSRAQLKRAALVDDVRNLLSQSQMQPEWLQLEVTESLAAQDEQVQITLRDLKGLGVKLALDDFGTGYSSLACLHLMPVDTVKIDRSFTKHAETVEYHRVLIEATIRVARTLGMTTVAEGIETEGQADLMLALECDRGQGYLYSKPLGADDLEAFVRSRDAALV
jgi:diguanylate cyclase (GGDEF)-like protein/PAS domain S-box-containing protein